LPAYDDYAMQGRTYRYFTKPVEYPFGFGMSYTHFDYTWQKEPVDIKNENEPISLEIKISNTGNFDSYDVPEVYVKYPDLPRMPVEELKGFQKVFIQKGKTKTVKFFIPVSELKKWDLKEGGWKLYRGKYQVCIGKNADEMILTKTIDIK
ncbi:MAG: fibronectin type III-like domain-contianing protein, partial [Ginsengibacter sp.]